MFFLLFLKFFCQGLCKAKYEEQLSMATSIILISSITNAFRNRQRDLFCQVGISIDITKKLKNTCERAHF